MITKAYIKAKILWIMPYSLMSFLIKKKALGNYLNNAYESWITTLKILHIREVKNLPIYTFYCNRINGAFTWKHTKEGVDYWCKLNSEYEKQKALQQEKLQLSSKSCNQGPIW